MNYINTGLPPQALSGSDFHECLLNKLPREDITLPQDIGYTAASTTFNAAYHYYPSAIVRPKDTNAVSDAVKCAVQAGVKVAARCGGHGYAAYSVGGADGYLVIDLVQLRKYEMDETTWTARLGGGLRLCDVDKFMQPDGRAMSHGTCPTVGLGGHATMGGLGPTSRMWGSSLDHVLEVEIVLADGSIVRASKDLEPDLFWAVQGAGSSFGIVTEFVVRTQPIPSEIVQYTYAITFSRPKDMAETFKAWQSFIQNPSLERRFASQVAVAGTWMLVRATFFGTQADFDATGFAQSLGSSGTVIVLTDWAATVALWAESEFLLLFGGFSWPFYAKSLDFTDNSLMPDETVDALFNYLDSNFLNPNWIVIFDLEGGAINDVASDATAYGHRDALFFMQTYAIGSPSMTVDFLNGINQTIRDCMPEVDFGAYAGYIDPLLVDAQKQYFGANLPRLEQLKKVYDPTEVYCNPQSIKPAA